MRIINTYPNFSNQGGAQDVSIQLGNSLNMKENYILTDTPKERICKAYRDKAIFLKFSLRNINRLISDDTIFISHHRKHTSILVLLNGICRKKIKLIHIAHNTFTDLKLFSFFPDNVIAVSSGVRENLIRHFRVKPNNIALIHNGLKDDFTEQNLPARDDDQIRIILLGRINSVKRQLEIARYAKGKLHTNIKFYFAGKGEDEELLKNEIADDVNFEYLGQINVKEQLPLFDYVCLFSEKEGLPLSLIEGLMFGKPLITNTLPAVLDVNKNTGFVFATLDELISGLNMLPDRMSADYGELSYNARQRYEKYFTEEKMISNYKKLLAKIGPLE